MADFMTYFNVFLYGVSWWLIPILVLFVYKKQLAKYPIDCIVYEKRGENIIYYHDVCGRFISPVECYRLKTSKDTIPIPQYDWILQNLSKPTNLLEKFANLLSGKVGAITLFKYGSKQYKPVEVKVSGETRKKFVEVKDKNGNSVWITKYELINPKQSMSKLEFEVIDWDDINHMTQEIRAIIQRRRPISGFFEKYGGHIIIALAIMALIFSAYFSKEMILEAGRQYTSTLNGAGGQQAPPVDLPLDDFLPD